MAGFRGILVLLWMCLLLLSNCSAKGSIGKRESAQDRIHLQKSQPYVKEEPGFLSRIAGWIFPFGGGSSKNELDSLPASGHHSAAYLPPPNKPIPKYLPPENLSPPHYPQSNQASRESSDCNPCNREPWIPIPGKSGRNSIINFVSPQEANKVLDGLNPPPQYGPPRPPIEEFHSPPPSGPQQNYNTPNNLPSYNQPQTEQELPKVEYGPPKNSVPSFQYEVPNIEITPSVLVGSLVIPQKPSISFNQYVPVNNGQDIPETPSAFPQLPNAYGPPFPQFRTEVTPSPFNIPSPNSAIRDHMIPPPVTQSQHSNYINIVGMRPPPPPSGGFTTHLNRVKQSKNPNSIQDILQPPVSQHSVLDEEYPPYTSKPIDAYSTPNIHGIEQIPLSSGDNDDLGYPIAFPNLSIRPLVPLHNYVKFNQGSRGGERVESIQILQSVPIADYVSSIEHPINVIQSPIVDLSIQNQADATKLNNVGKTNKFTGDTTYNVPSKPNTIQSGIFVNPNINSGKFQQNPIVVDDVQTAASSHNETYQKSDHTSKRDNDEDIGVQSSDSSTLPTNTREEIEDINSNLKSNLDKKNASKELKYTQPPLDYSQWTPTWGGISMEMTPPSVNSWTTSFDTTQAPPKKAKHIQIIIPYYNFNNSSKGFTTDQFYSRNSFLTKSHPRKDTYTTLLPGYTSPPSTEESLWSQFLTNGLPSDSASAFQLPSTTGVYNIQDLLGVGNPQISGDLPFDILTFQKNIDEWTHQAFAKTTEKLSSGQGVIQSLNPSKRIPDQYLTTVPYDYTTVQPLNNYLDDQEPAGSNKKENFQDEIGNNLILNDFQSTTTESSTVSLTAEMTTESGVQTTPLSNTKEKTSLWESTQVAVSPVTKEKVYIVTPASPVAWSSPPKVLKMSTTTENTLLFEHPKFTIKIERNSTNSNQNLNGTTKVIFSEWPHKINNLQTTTERSTSRHPLFGLMDVSAYNPPQNKVIANVNGHSRVLQDLASFIGEQSNTKQ